MAEVTFSVACDNAIIDSRTGKFSIINILDEIHIRSEEFPTTNEWIELSLQLNVVTAFVRSDWEKPERAIAALKIAAPRGDIYSKQFELEVDLERSKICRNLAIFNAPVHAPGVHFVIIEMQDGPDKWKEAYKFPIVVIWDKPTSV